MGVGGAGDSQYVRVSHYEVSETDKSSRNVWEWRNSVSKRDRGKGLRDVLFWRKFEGVM